MLKFSGETGIRIIFLGNLARIWQKKKKNLVQLVSIKPQIQGTCFADKILKPKIG